jgi:hypothetical protein
MKTITILFISCLYAFACFSQQRTLTQYEDSLNRTILIVYDGKKAKDIVKDMENLGPVSGMGEDLKNRYYIISENLRLDIRKKAAPLKAEVIVITKFSDGAIVHKATGYAYRKKQAAITTTESPQSNTNENQ